MNNKDIKITIVTVCYNAEKYIRETMMSVLKQTYTNIEYIIVDGASTDNTISIIKELGEKYPVRYISEKDHGIYDAMNKGIKMATGQYLQFLNAGDVLCNEKIIEKVVSKISKNKADLYYGNIVYVYPDGKEDVRMYGKSCGRKIYYYTGDCINHQAIFASAECFGNELFDLSYHICADREWMMRLTKKHKRFECLDMLICRYSLDEDSASIRDKERYNFEAKKCIKAHFPQGYLIYCMFDLCRNNKILANVLHKIYELLYIKR